MIPTAPSVRLNRSQLSVPGIRPELFEKAARSAADVIFLDLEDSVAPGDKAQARQNVIAGLRDVDWHGKTVSVRVNGLDTPYMYRDVIDVMEQAGERLDLLLVPKVSRAADVHAVDLLLSQVEMAKGYVRPVGLELMIETAEGLMNVDAIAGASARAESLHFGPGDFAASTGARNVTIGGGNPDYAVLVGDKGGRRDAHVGDMWHYALARIVVAARAHGLRPLDGPYADYADPEGFDVAARRAAALGCEGKWCIHPSQIAAANAAFGPLPAEVEAAKRILSAMAEAGRAGKGAATLDGRMIDLASVRQAEVVVRKADLIAARPAQ
ncbi:MAG TPA: CoA ester lyase [Alphaproteobacteria bacterium]|jgi:malyl-CoA/(S)-citramalyl-CoA lyase